MFSLMDIDPVKWIDDILAIGQNGTGVKLTWLAGTAWRGAEVERILRRYGVRVYARQYTTPDNKRDYGVTVRAKQADWADYLLRKAGVPVSSPERNVVAVTGAMPQAKGTPAKPVGFGGLVVSILLGKD